MTFPADSFLALIDASDVGGELTDSEEWAISSLTPSAESLWLAETLGVEGPRLGLGSPACPPRFPSGSQNLSLTWLVVSRSEDSQHELAVPDSRRTDLKMAHKLARPLGGV